MYCFSRFIALLACSVAVSVSASAQALKATPSLTTKGPVYGVLSLIGDEFGVVVGRGAIGLNSDTRNATVPMTNPLFDVIVVEASARALKRLDPTAEVASIDSRSPVLFQRFRSLFEKDRGVMTIPEPILQVLREQQATHFILVTKHRGDAKLPTPNPADAPPRLEGLGFYVSSEGTVGSSSVVDAAATPRGFLATYALFRMELVELATQRVLKARDVVATSTFPPNVLKGQGDPWSALSASEKLRALETLIRREIEQVVPVLLVQ